MKTECITAKVYWTDGPLEDYVRSGRSGTKAEIKDRLKKLARVEPDQLYNPALSNVISTKPIYSYKLVTQLVPTFSDDL